MLVRRTDRFEQAVKELTGETRVTPLWTPSWCERYDYSKLDLNRLRRDWATLMKTVSIRLDFDHAFAPIWEALDKKRLSQCYGDLRQACSERPAPDENEIPEDFRLCPVIEETTGKPCAERLYWFFDPENEGPVKLRQVNNRAKILSDAGTDP